MDDHEQRSLSRRQAVRLVGLGIAAATAPALSQPTGQRSNISTSREPAMQDPRAKYPKPPFESQTQPWPGLAGKMNPKAADQRWRTGAEVQELRQYYSLWSSRSAGRACFHLCATGCQ
jgi:hypothetical protein